MLELLATGIAVLALAPLLIAAAIIYVGLWAAWEVLKTVVGLACGLLGLVACLLLMGLALSCGGLFLF